MKEEFITFEKFNNLNSANELGDFFSEQNIEYLLVDNSLSFDPTFANNDFGKEYCIKIKKHDFVKVNKIVLDKAEKEIEIIEDDYYLLSFSDDELIDVVSKSDEWNKFDVSLAQKLLKERGNEITANKIEEIKKNRIHELSKPEESQNTYIILGYILAFLGGFLAIFIGWHLLTFKKTLPDGNSVYAYSENDRKQGNKIFLIGIIFSILWIIIRILF